MKLNYAAVVFPATFAFVGCLEYSPYEASVCRSGTYEDTSGDFVVDDNDEGAALRLPGESQPALEGCTRVETLIVEGFADSGALSRLANVTQIGAVRVGPTTGLDRFDGLGQVEQIAGDFTIFDNQNLASLTELTDLAEIGGGLLLEDNPMLTFCEAEALLGRLDRLPNAVSVGGLMPCDDPVSTVDLGASFVAPTDTVFIAGATDILDLDFADPTADLAAESLFVVHATSGRDIALGDRDLTLIDAPPDALITADEPARGVALAVSLPREAPTVQPEWTAFIGGFDWPTSDADDEVQLRFAAHLADRGRAVFVGWISSEAQIGPWQLDCGGFEPVNALFVGTISSTGAVQRPCAIGQANADNGACAAGTVARATTSTVVPACTLADARLSPRAVPRLIQANGDDEVWVVLEEPESEFFNLLRIDINGEVLLDLPIAVGPVRFDGIRRTEGGDVVLTGRRDGQGIVEVGGQPVRQVGGFAFTLRVPVDGDLDATVVALDGGFSGQTVAPACAAIGDDGASWFLGAEFVESTAVARVERVLPDGMFADPVVLPNVDGAPLLGLPAEPQLACGILSDGRLVASSLDAFQRGLASAARGWRLGAIDIGAEQPLIRSTTVGRIEGVTRDLDARLADDGRALLFGPVPAVLNLGQDDSQSRAARRVFLAQRRIAEGD